MTLRNELGRLRYWWSGYPADLKRGLAIYTAIAAAVFVLIGGGFWVYQTFIDTDPVPAVVTSRDWERQIEIEQFKTIQDRDWRGQEPDDARIYDEKREIHHWEQELSHYRTVTESYSCGSYDRPQTCYRTRQEPVYVSVPVYRTRLYYEVDRWVTHRWVVSQGRELQPVWPALPDTLNPVAALGNERKGDDTKERYTIHVKCGRCDDGSKVNVPLSEWDDFTIAREVTALVTARGTVKDIKVPAQGT